MVEQKRSILIISGLDPGGGAGFIADVRVAHAQGMRTAGVVTALTEQDTLGVRQVHPVPADVIADQLRAILTDIEVSAVKIGMLGNEDITVQVADALSAARPPAVWDPIVRPTSGSVYLYQGNPLRALQLLSSHIGVITPNVLEAELLAGRAIRSLDDMRSAARELRERLGGQAAVLLKGGHLPGHEAVDVLATSHDIIELHGQPIQLAEPVHGTGCALSTALACNLGLGMDMVEAARAAKELVAASMRDPQRPGRGAPSVM